MAWTMVTKTQRMTDTLIHYTWDGQADATDLSDAVVVDFSGINPQGGYDILKIEWMRLYASGVNLTLQWDATTDVHLLSCPDGQMVDYPPPGFRKLDIESGGGQFIVDPAGTGYSGDILATTTGGAVGDGARIEAVFTLQTA